MNKTTTSLYNILVAQCLVLILATTSCSDYLDLEPEDDLVSSEFWQTREDVDAVIAGAYSNLASLSDEFLFWGELRGGLLTQGLNAPSIDALRIMLGDINAQNSLTNWAGLYRTINFANSVITFAPDVVGLDPSYSQEDMLKAVAEARFIRSVCYFYLVRVFGEAPLITEPYTTDEQDFFPAKSSEAELIQQVISDLVIAENQAELDFNRLEYNKGRATRFAIQALLADVYLWNNDYDKAIEMGDKVINSGRFVLQGGDQWFDNFAPGNSNESIFEVQFGVEFGQTNSFYRWFSYEDDGAGQYSVSESLLELYESSDVRAEYGTYYFEEGISGVWKYVGKAADPSQVRNISENDNNYLLYRLADIYLIQAEAHALLGDFANALEKINTLRQNKGASPAIISENRAAFEDFILDERARELAYEGKYWFDVLRIGRRDNGARRDLIIEALIANATAQDRSLLQAKFQDSNSWFLPINQGELSINNNLEQNPYYVN